MNFMVEYDILGVGEVYETPNGTMRGKDEGRGQPSLVSPHLMLRLSKHMQKATKKYTPGNWAIGQPFSRIIDGIYRHLSDYQLGKKEEDNLAAVAFGIMCLIHFEEEGREIELNDIGNLYGLDKRIHTEELES